MDPFEYDVFLSFAAADEALVKPLWQQLCLSGLRVFWSDATLKNSLGASWFDIIQNSLERSHHLLLVCTPTSMSSDWVKREYVAFYNHFYRPQTRRLIPLLTRGFTAAQLPLFLRELEACELEAFDSMRLILRSVGGVDIEALKTALEEKEHERRQLAAEVERLTLELSRLGAVPHRADPLSERVGPPSKRVVFDVGQGYMSLKRGDGTGYPIRFGQMLNVEGCEEQYLRLSTRDGQHTGYIHETRVRSQDPKSYFRLTIGSQELNVYLQPRCGSWQDADKLSDFETEIGTLTIRLGHRSDVRDFHV